MTYLLNRPGIDIPAFPLISPNSNAKIHIQYLDSSIVETSIESKLARKQTQVADDQGGSQHKNLPPPTGIKWISKSY